MLLPQVNYYDIQDIGDTGGKKKELTVVAEYDNRREAEVDARQRKIGNCEVYYETERDGKRYRVICERTKMVSGAR